MLQLKRQVSESYFIGLLLAIAGGYLDVYTYISRGGVFANAQTGNIVLLGIHIAQQNFEKITTYTYCWQFLLSRKAFAMIWSIRQFLSSALCR